MTYEEVFTQIKSIFMEADVSGEKEHLAFQFNVTGEGEGAFYAEVKEGTLCVEPYEYYDRDAVLPVLQIRFLSWPVENLIRFLPLPQEN